MYAVRLCEMIAPSGNDCFALQRQSRVTQCPKLPLLLSRGSRGSEMPGRVGHVTLRLMLLFVLGLSNR